MKKELVYHVGVGERTFMLEGKKLWTDEMDEEDFYELASEKGAFIDDFTSCMDTVKTLEIVYGLGNHNTEIANKVLHESIYDDYPEGHYIKESIVEDYSEEILNEVEKVVASYYSTDDISDRLDNNELYKKFVADQVSEIIAIISNLSHCIYLDELREDMSESAKIEDF